MSIVSFNEIWQDRGAESSGVDNSTGARQWRVVTNDKANDSSFVLAYGLLNGIVPNLYSQHPTNAYLTARTLRADSQSESPLHWIVTATYSSVPVPTHEKDKEQNPNPLNRAVRVKWDTSLYREAVEKDVDGDAILNSAGDYFDPPVERDRSNWVATVTKNLPQVPGWLLDFNNCPINQSSFTIDGVSVDAKKARLTTISIGEEAEENGNVFRTLSMQIEFKKEGWTAKVLDQGLRQKGEGDNAVDRVSITVQDDAGGQSKVTSPVLLNGSGKVLKDPGPENAKFMDFELYEAKDFSILPLT